LFLREALGSMSHFLTLSADRVPEMLLAIRQFIVLSKEMGAVVLFLLDLPIRPATSFYELEAMFPTMLKRITLAVFLLAALCGVARADAILDWNATVLEVVRTEAKSPTEASRSLAMVQTAVFDAVNAIDRRYSAFQYKAYAAAGTSKEAAIAQAAYDVVRQLYPAKQAFLDSQLSSRLALIAEGAGKSAGRALGSASASSMLRLRAGDGSDNATPHVPPPGPGHWRPTPPDFSSAVTPKWGEVTPFTLQSPAQFRPNAPPALNSPEYTAAFNQVKALGSKASATRTADQTEIGVFWAYDVGGVGPPPVLYNQIAAAIATQEGNSLVENARLFALINLAQADAGIATWEAKYIYDLWRPITAIREADTDGNPDTVADPNWQPLGAPGDGLKDDFTPPFPAYTSGHAAFGAALFGVLEEFYGTDKIGFTIGSDEFDGVRRPKAERSYDSFSEASLENALSRLYLGVHWEFDSTVGMALGDNVAQWVFTNALTEVPVPGTLMLLASGLCGLAAMRKTSPKESQRP
jgi:hypothetical protein